MTPGTRVVERFLDAMTSHDWNAMGACVSEDVERVGPFGDTYRGRKEYLTFISSLIPSLPGYSMEMSRVVYGPGGRTAMVELSETVEVEGKPRLTPESLVFDIDDEGRIAHVSIYIQRLGENPRQWQAIKTS